MVDYRLDTTFKALADPTRRQILASLQREAATVSYLADQFDMSLQAVLKHVKVLERAQLLSSKKHGRQRIVSLTAMPLEEATDWLEAYRKFWDQRLDALAAYLEGEENDDHRPES